MRGGRGVTLRRDQSAGTSQQPQPAVVQRPGGPQRPADRQGGPVPRAARDFHAGIDGDEPAAQMTQLLHHLGYRSVAVVKKHRRQYPLERGAFRLTICLDDVEGLGHFAEAEPVLRTGVEKAAEPDVCTRLLVDLQMITQDPQEKLRLLKEAIALNGNLAAAAVARVAMNQLEMEFLSRA